MLPDRVSNPGPLTYELGALPIALRGPAAQRMTCRDSWPADLAVPGLSPTDGGNLFYCNQPFIISSSHRPV